MKNCRRPFASILLALALGMPVWAGDMSSTPTTPAPPPPPAPSRSTGATAPSDNCSGNALSSAEWNPAVLAMDLLCSMLSIYY